MLCSNIGKGNNNQDRGFQTNVKPCCIVIVIVILIVIAIVMVIVMVIVIVATPAGSRPSRLLVFIGPSPRACL